MSKEYGRVSPQFWTGATGRAIRGNQEAQIVGLYLMTCEAANMIGVFRIPLVFISHDTGLPLEGASKGLRSLSERGFCVYDSESEYVWVRKMGFWQVEGQLKETDNRVKAVQKQVELLPNLPFLKEFYEVYAAPFHLEMAHELEGASKPLESPSEASNSNSNSNKSSSTGNVERCPVQKIIDLYNRTINHLPVCRVASDLMRKNISARWKEHEAHQQIEFWRNLFEYCESNTFLSGRSNARDGAAPFRASLDWIVKPTNFAKIVNGNYDRDSETAAA